MPIVGSCENDTLTLCRQSGPDLAWPEPPPPATGVVDAAIELFSVLLPLQDIPSASLTISHVIQCVRSSKLERNLGRKSAVFINATVALLFALRKGSQLRNTREVFGSTRVASTLADFVKVSYRHCRVLFIPSYPACHECRTPSSMGIWYSEVLAVKL